MHLSRPVGTLRILGLVPVVILAALGSVLPAQQTPPAAPASPGRIVRMEPALDAIVAPDAAIEKMTGGLTFTEGPVWMQDGSLVFTEFREHKLMRLVPGQPATATRMPGDAAGYEGTGLKAFAGANGLTLDKQGRLILCETGNRAVTRLEPNGKMTLLADKWEGKHFIEPNDVVSTSDGSLYITDPLVRPNDPRRETPHLGAVYRIKNGKVDLITSELPTPNGLAFSPDEKYLYVDNLDLATTNAKRYVKRFEVKKDGTVGPGMMFHDFTGATGAGQPDGMKVDKKGNVYVTGPGGVWIITPAGKVLGKIEAPEVVYNLGWGDDGKSLYLTSGASVYRVRMKASGKRPCCDK